MNRTVIRTDQAPGAIGPYNQAIRVGDTLFCSGQIALLPSGELLDGDVTAQTRQVLTNLGKVLEAAGMSYANVVKTTVFLSTMDHFAAMNAVYAEFFPSEAPARSTVAVAGLPKAVDVEIEAIALA